MGPQPLNSYTDIDTVSNVCLFVCDSLRADYLPEWIRQRGIAAESIAPASYTAASVPSLLTGVYPATHGCWTFHNQLDHRPRLFERQHSYRADTIWTHLDGLEKPPAKITNAEASVELDELEKKFVYVEHHKGGHSPYGHSFAEHSTPTFFDELENADEIPSLYQCSIESAAERFAELLKTLESRGILNETLVVFTSDHGELLGEASYGGLYGHGRPVVPEVVRTPLIFLGAGLPEGIEYESLTAGVDIAPTLMGAMSEEAHRDTDGVDLWWDTPDTRTPRSEYWTSKTLRRREQDVYRVTSGWSKRGGVVRHIGPRWSRIGYALYAHLYSEPEARHVRRSITPARFRNLVSTYFPKIREYGTTSEIDADELLDIGFAACGETEREFPEEQLRRLGYID